MKTVSTFFAALSIALVGASTLPAVAASPAQPQAVRTVDGVAYYDVNPGPIDPGSYWTSGEYKYDPNGYMETFGGDSSSGIHEMTVYADHAGKDNCVFRARVPIGNWDFHHPYVQVCREPQTN